MILSKEQCAPHDYVRMNAVLAYWIEHPLLKHVDLCEQCGIGATLFWKYRQNEYFMRAFNAAQRLKFESMLGAAMEQLESKVQDGEWLAIKYVLDGNDYAAKQKIEATTSTISIKIEGDDTNVQGNE